MKPRNLTHCATLLSLTALAFSTGLALGATNYTGASKSNGDSWSTTSSWTPTTVPTGAVDVVINAGKYATADLAGTPVYSGSLTLQAGSSVQAGYGGAQTNAFNALGTPGSTVITMEEGSFILTRGGFTKNIPQIILNGNAWFGIGASTSASPNLTFKYGINGPYTFKLSGKSGSVMDLTTVANSFKELVTDASYGSNFNINANVAGALGGNVTILPTNTNTITANLTIGAANAMADTATLTLNGPASATKLKISAADTIGKLVIDGVQQPDGTYGKIGSGAQYEVSWINASSTSDFLTVAGPAPSYWDSDDTIAGSGPTDTPTGTWGTDPFWSSSVDGDVTTTAWTAGGTAVFAAGTDATGAYAVTVAGTQDIGGLRIEEGAVTISGDGLRMTSDSLLSVASGTSLAVGSVISNDTAHQLTKGGDGTLVLSGANSYTGVTSLQGGILSVASLAAALTDSPIGNFAAGAGGLDLAAGTFQYTGATTSTTRGLTLSGSGTVDVSAAGTVLTLGDIESTNGPGTLTVTGGAGSSLSVGRVRIVEAAQATLNPTTIPMTVATINGYTSYALSSLITLDGSATGNVVTGVIDRTNPPTSGFTQPIALNKSGSSDWTLNGASNYPGNTTVLAGNLIAGTNALNNATGAFGQQNNVDLSLGVANGSDNAGILIGGAYTIGRNIRLKTQNTTDSGSRVITLGSTTADSSVYSAAVYLGDLNQTSRGVTLTAASSGTVTFSGVIQDPTGQDATEAAAAAALTAVTKAGLGTVALTNANTYSGNTLVSEGTLSLGNGTSNSNLNDFSTVSVASGGAKLNLNYVGSDTVLFLNLGGSPILAGQYGHTDSGATNGGAGVGFYDAYFEANTGVINNYNGILANAFLWDGGAVDIAGNGNTSSDGGTGTWDAAIKNWDIGNTPYVAWGNTSADKAVFGGVAGTVTLGANMNIGEMEISLPSNTGTGYFIGEATEDNTLTFAGTKTITATATGTGTNQDVTIYAGIAGSPTMNIAGRLATGVNTFNLLPTSDVTQTIGTLNMLNTFASNKRLILGGESTGNVVDTVAWATTTNQLMLTKAGTGSWTINNDVLGIGKSGRLYVEQGTLTLGGTNNYFTHKVGVSTTRETAFTASGTSSKLVAKGIFTIGDNREYFYVQNAGTISPGPGVGTLQVKWNGNNNAAGTHGQFNMQTGSTYEWDVASSTSTDVIDVQKGVSSVGNLILGNISLKIKDAGATTAIADTDPLTVFTYQTGVTRSIGTVTFDTSALGAGWTVGTLTLTDNGTGTVYLTGLAFTPGGPAVDHFAISAISSPQTVGTAITGITITAQDVSNATDTSFTGTVTFGGTAGITGTSASFTAGVLSGVSVTPSVIGTGLTFTVDDGASHTGTASFDVQSLYNAWAGGAVFDADANGDGVKNGLAFLLGASGPNGAVTLPTVTEGGGGLVMTFNCLPVAARGTATLKVSHSNTLAAWTPTVAVVPDATNPTPDNDVTFVVVAGPVAPPALNTVTATIDAAAAAAGKLFGRLEAEQP
jgi:fibronectin-binding autotransporter adhesin